MPEVSDTIITEVTAIPGSGVWVRVCGAIITYGNSWVGCMGSGVCGHHLRGYGNTEVTAIPGSGVWGRECVVRMKSDRRWMDDGGSI